MEKIVKGVYNSMGDDYKLNHTPWYSPTINNAEAAEIMKAYAVNVVGEKYNM